ncbi:SMC-Scp complex subunit ScpB [Methylotetracoccus oryzae]|uniref:SMC-Scp complex subunit ScpB n=1 Tax=Methylotetracoccus oryzae TaxID=1919059 RepID=UPI00111AFA6F|nr:SMC-Scp complex subunit ScpB [Methylotetracoccus oryzae]
MNLKDIVEAALFASPQPLSVEALRNLFEEAERPDVATVREAIDQLTQDYAVRPVQLQQIASGFRFQVRDGYSPWLSRLFEERPVRYSRALLETLAIIAYRQPVTRGEIEDIRGVAVSSNIVRTLQEREWVQVVGHKEVPGRPALYATTREFLDYFGLRTLSELPALAVFSEPAAEGDEAEAAPLLPAASESPDALMTHIDEPQ